MPFYILPDCGNITACLCNLSLKNKNAEMLLPQLIRIEYLSANPTKDLGIRSKAFSIYFGIDPKNYFGHRPKGFEGMEIGLIFLYSRE